MPKGKGNKSTNKKSLKQTQASSVKGDYDENKTVSPAEELPFPNIFERMQFRKIDGIEKENLENINKIKSLTKARKLLAETKDNILYSYRDVLDKSFIDQFKEIYTTLCKQLLDQKFKNSYTGSLLTNFVNLGRIFSLQYFEYIDRFEAPNESSNSLFMNSYKYFSYAFDLLKTPNYKRFIKLMLNTNELDVDKELKDELLKQIIDLNDIYLGGLISEGTQFVRKKNLNSLTDNVILLYLIGQLLQLKQEFGLFLCKEEIGDKLENKKKLESVIRLIYDIKQQFHLPTKEDLSKIDFYKDFIPEYIEQRKEIRSNLLTLRLIEEQETENFIKSISRLKFEDSDNEEGDIYNEPVIEEKEEENVITLKQELSLGQSELIKARNICKENHYDQAVNYYKAAKRFFIDNNDIENELNARIGIADCFSAKASMLVKEFYALRKPFSNQHLLEEAQENLKIATEDYKDIIENFLANEDITTINFDGDTYNRQDVIELFKKTAADFLANLQDIDIVIETNIVLLEGKVEEWSKFREYKYIEYGLKYYLAQIAINNYQKGYIDTYINDLIYFMPPSKWDHQTILDYIEYQYKIRPSSVEEYGICCWRNNPIYAGLSENDRVSLLQNTESALTRKALEFYKNLESKNNAIKTEVNFFQEKVGNIFEKSETTKKELTTHYYKPCLAQDNVWSKVKDSKIFVLSEQNRIEKVGYDSSQTNNAIDISGRNIEVDE